MTIQFDLTCWYLNARRIAELVGMEVVTGNRVPVSDQFQRLADLDALRRSIVQWIASNAPQPIEKLFVEEKLREGCIITLHTNFFFKGLTKFAGGDNSRAATLPSAYAKLDYLKDGLKLTFDLHPEHLTSTSAWATLSGQKRMFLLAVVTDVTNNEIKAKPYTIANIVEHRGVLASGEQWLNHLEVHVDQIDSFALVQNEPRARTKKALDVLKTIPEQDVKEAFADIIGEAIVPKDWGGEKSDLFSSGLKLNGKRRSTAFAFKGPAKFRPMTMAELGKNGDQINRLYEEPADLLVLQHCHEITPPVRRMMRAFAQQMGNPRNFCVIDGFDTLRLLAAYSKCGLTPKGQGAAGKQ